LSLFDEVSPPIVATDTVDVLSALLAPLETDARPIVLIDENDAAASCNFAVVIDPALTVALSCTGVKPAFVALTL
jgi:hypothetical protein